MKTVILAAGFGSRLWPLSTSERPKQFQALIDDRSLLQHTYELMSQVTPVQELYVLTLTGLEQLVFEQLPGIDPQNVIIVPERRNTLPHTLYAMAALDLQPTEPVLFCPVDHYMVNPVEFVQDLTQVVADISETDQTALICMKASTIDSGLGYLQVDEHGVVTNFVEKPGVEEMAELEQAGNAYVNTLRFVTSVSAMKQLLAECPESYAGPAAGLLEASAVERNDQMLALPMIDISHGLFEYGKSLRAIDIESAFIDIGRFKTLYEINPKDGNGNVVVGKVVLDAASSNNYAINQTGAPLAIIDTHDSVVVQTVAGSFVAPMDQAEAIGELYKSQIINLS